MASLPKLSGQAVYERERGEHLLVSNASYKLAEMLEARVGILTRQRPRLAQVGVLWHILSARREIVGEEHQQWRNGMVFDEAFRFVTNDTAADQMDAIVINPEKE